MNDEDTLPDVPNDLLEWMEQRYALRAPSVHDTLSHIQRAAGRYDVLTDLRNLRDKNLEAKSSKPS